MKRWFFPSWCGDFRLTADGDNKCILTVESPTPAEINRLGTFLKKARSKDWVKQHVGFVPNSKIDISVNAPIAKAGKLLLDRKVKGVLTAVKSVSGKVSAVTDTDTPPAKAEEAASVRRPTLCCPEPQPGPEVRASQVLQSFSTPAQWEEWQKFGMLHCFGNLSGRQYEIVHRHHPLAVKRKKIVWDIEGGYILHCYDWSVPPPEEVLTMKLVLEHAEHWIRNQSGCYHIASSPNSDIYTDPFVSEEKQLTDGLLDASIVSTIGQVVKGAVTGFKAMEDSTKSK